VIEILQIKIVPDAENFSIAVLGRNGLLWIVLADPTLRKCYKFWSQQGTADSASIEDIVSELSIRLANTEADSLEFREKVRFWPVGWDWWGLGRPQPIADFIAYEFQDAISDFLGRQGQVRQ
jgi:hypothetical protein